MIVYENDLDVVPGAGATVPKINLSQNDDDFTLIFHLFARTGTLTIESGTTAKLCGVKKDGTAYEKAASLNGTDVTFKGDKNLTDTPGKGTFELCLTHAGSDLYTANFSIAVEQKPSKGGA